MSNINSINFLWAKTPSFKKEGKEVLNDGFIAFSEYVPPDIYRLSKDFWQGNVNHKEKKCSVFSLDLIERLLQETYIVNIGEVLITRSLENIPGTHIINKVINLSENSPHEEISNMAKKQIQNIIYSQIKNELWQLFEPSQVINLDDYIKDNSLSHAVNPFKTGEWTTVTPIKNGREFDFNLNEGILHYEQKVKTKEMEILTIHRISKLKNEKNLLKLIKLVTDLKKYGLKIAEMNNLEYNSKWVNGFSM